MSYSSLSFEAESGDIRGMALHLKRGADVNERGSLNDTPLHTVVKRGYTEAVELLLDHGADLDAQNEFGETPLGLAVRQGYTNIVDLLLKHGADVTGKGKDGETLLHRAAQYGYTEIPEVLLDYGADVDAQNEFGETPLLFALMKGHIETAKLLLEHGATMDPQWEEDGLVPDDIERRLETFATDPQTMPEDSSTDDDERWTPAKLLALDPIDFEYLVARIWEEKGFGTDVSAATGDAGIDVHAIKDDSINPMRVAIQCKRHGDPVGRQVAQQLIGSIREEHSEAILICVGGFTSSCVEYAQTQGRLKLIDGERLCDILNSHDIPAH